MRASSGYMGGPCRHTRRTSHPEDIRRARAISHRREHRERSRGRRRLGVASSAHARIGISESWRAASRYRSVDSRSLRESKPAVEPSCTRNPCDRRLTVANFFPEEAEERLRLVTSRRSSRAFSDDFSQRERVDARSQA